VDYLTLLLLGVSRSTVSDHRKSAFMLPRRSQKSV
jgi:hypothetical protein